METDPQRTVKIASLLPRQKRRILFALFRMGAIKQSEGYISGTSKEKVRKAFERILVRGTAFGTMFETLEKTSLGFLLEPLTVVPPKQLCAADRLTATWSAYREQGDVAWRPLRQTAHTMVLVTSGSACHCARLRRFRLRPQSGRLRRRLGTALRQDCGTYRRSELPRFHGDRFWMSWTENFAESVRDYVRICRKVVNNNAELFSEVGEGATAVSGHLTTIGLTIGGISLAKAVYDLWTSNQNEPN